MWRDKTEQGGQGRVGAMNDSVKIILAGDFGVGKTCLLLQWVEGKFVPDASTTVDSGRCILLSFG